MTACATVVSERDVDIADDVGGDAEEPGRLHTNQGRGLELGDNEEDIDLSSAMGVPSAGPVKP